MINECKDDGSNTWKRKLINMLSSLYIYITEKEPRNCTKQSMEVLTGDDSMFHC